MSRTAAILLAAGSGKRMKGSVADKILAPLAGRPVFAYSAAAFMESQVADLYVVVYRDRRQMLELAAIAPTPSLLVRGGSRRQDSVIEALAALPPDIAYVFIHDCARPMIRAAQLVALHKSVRRTGAVVLARPVIDTIKEAPRGAKRGDAGHLRTLERDRLWAMETPQVFERKRIVRAYAAAAARGIAVTDDAAALELIRAPVALEENPFPNPKLTGPSDLLYLEYLLSRSGGAPLPPGE